MKVVVTGATGHVGRYTVYALAQAGHTVVAASRGGGMPALPFGATGPVGDVRPLAADITSVAAVDVLAAELGPEVGLVHLAAWHPPATAATTTQDRARLLHCNVFGTMHVLDAARRARRGAAVVVYASSFEVYGAIEAAGDISEETRVEPLTDYGVTKLAGEDHLIAFGQEERTRVVALRMPAVYGPGEQTARALPNFLRQVARGERPVIYGDGLDLRDQLHVRDAAHAVVCALTSSATGIFCVADGQPHSIQALAQTALAVAGLPGDPAVRPREKPRRDYHMSTHKARQDLGYTARVRLFEGMAEQLAWLREGHT